MYSDQWDRADVFLRLAESYYRQLMGRERFLPPAKKKEKKIYIYIKHHQLDVSLLGQHSWM